MPIGADAGQDIILAKSGRRVGLIQCKLYQSLLSISECAKEIIKFALNAICDPSLITDRDEYSYFLAVASQFSTEAISFLASFNTRILQETRLESWTNQVIKRYFSSFGHLNFHETRNELIDILSRIRVETIIPTQLDEWLHQSAYASIVEQFFPDVLMVVPVDTARNKRTNAQLIEELLNASVDLASWSTPFEHSGFMHLERAETAQLLQWIRNPLPLADDKSKLPDSAIFLIGSAGSGKTTMLRDLLLTLHQQRVPVIGLKADRLIFTQRSDLEEALGLSTKLDEAIRQLAKEHPRVVVLIDQLDALSQSLSANRHGILTYNRLIEQLARLPNTRLVISCRRYDFDYDPVLVQFRNRPKVEVMPLSDEQVEEVLHKLALTKGYMTAKLFELLHIPLHLTLFCQVYRDVADLATLVTLQDLYHALWTQKVLYVPDTAAVTVDQVRSLLQTMASQMYEQQQISLPLRRYESQYRAAINYLSSQSLITQYDNKLQFFHQSFFDYVFARSFVERGNSLTDDILSGAKHQGLFIRSQIRQVLAYLRETDEIGYKREIGTLLCSTNIRFHIQLLTIQHLASQADPLAIEYRLFQSVIQRNSLLLETFLEAINTPNWFRYITQNFGDLFDLADPIEYDRLYQLCRRIQYWCPDDLIQFLYQLPPSVERGSFIGNVLFVLDDFTNPLILELFEEVYALRPANELWFYHVMEHALVSRPDWVGDQIERRLLQLISPIEAGYNVKLPDQQHAHKVMDCLEKLYEKLPPKAIAVGLAIIESLLTKSKPFDWEGIPTGLIVDSMYHDYAPEDAEHDTSFGLLAKLETWLCTQLDSDPTEATHQLHRLMEKKYVTLIALGLQGATHLPVLLADMLFNKLDESRWLEDHNLVHHNYFERAVRGALRVSFSHWLPRQQQRIADRILAFNPKKEYYYCRSQNNQLFGATGFRQYNLIGLLPQEFIKSYEPIKKRHQELKRKFSKYQTNDMPSGRIATVGGRAMSPSAYAKMTNKHWLRSFIHYNQSEPKWDSVDELTHAQRFEQEIKQRPSRFISLLEAIIAQPDIPDIYLFYGLDGLAESDCDPSTFKRLFLSSLTRSLEEQYVIRLIRLTDYWVKRKTFDLEAFDFLERCARYGTEEMRVHSEIDLLNRGVNTVRGAAIHRMYHWVHEKAYTEQCFDIVSQAGIDGSLTTRATALFDQAQFNQHDLKRSMELFLSLCDGHEVDLASVAWHPLQYHIHGNFQLFIPYLESCIEASKQLRVMAKLAMIAYMNGYEGSEGVMERYLEKGAEAIKGALDIALSSLTAKDKARRDRCATIGFRFLEYTGEKVGETYLSAIRKFKDTEFRQLLPFLEEYVQSNVGEIRGHEFYTYLMKCVKNYPNDCIRLAANFDRHLGPDITHRYLRNEPINVILQAYNRLEEFQAPTGEKERAMDVFDRMLVDPRYRVLLSGVTTALN